MSEDQPIDPRLDEALDQAVPRARAVFRDSLRERFVGASPGEAENDAENEAGNEDVSVHVEPRLAAALDAWQPIAHPEFREELQDEFVEGLEYEDEYEEEDEHEEILERRPQRVVRRTNQPASRAPRSARTDRGRSWTARLLVGGVLAAAAGVVAFFALRSPAAPIWQVVGGEYVASSLEIDGNTLPAGIDGRALEALLATAETVKVVRGPAVRMRFGNEFVVEIAPQSALDISGVSETQFTLSMAEEAGAFRIATGPDFDSATDRLAFNTPDSTTEVHGTIFGIDRFKPGPTGKGGGTCICCCDGEVAVASKDAAGVASRAIVPETEMTFVFAGGGAVRGPVKANHLAPLENLAKFTW